MTTLIDDPRDGDLVACVYRRDNDSGWGWLAEVQKRWGGKDSFSLYESLQAVRLTKLGAKLAARNLLRRAKRLERARWSKANPIVVARVRVDE